MGSENPIFATNWICMKFVCSLLSATAVLLGVRMNKAECSQWTCAVCKTKRPKGQKGHIMSKQSKAEEIYEIAKDASGPIRLSELADMLGYPTSRSVAPRVSSAYWWYDDPDGGNDAAACELIAHVFVDRNGNYAWWR